MSKMTTKIPAAAVCRNGRAIERITKSFYYFRRITRGVHHGKTHTH